MIDLLCIGPHPDDCESCVGGIMLKAKKAGLKTGIIILTDGRAGGAGRETEEEMKALRKQEALAGARLLGVDYFCQLDFRDDELMFTKDVVDALVPLLNESRPRNILTLHPDDHHPDHRAVSEIVRKALFDARLKRNHTPGEEKWHWENLFYFSDDYFSNGRFPDLLFDVSDVIEEKKACCAVHKTQPGIVEEGVRLCRVLGEATERDYLEGLYLTRPAMVPDVGNFFRKV